MEEYTSDTDYIKWNVEERKYQYHSSPGLFSTGTHSSFPSISEGSDVTITTETQKHIFISVLENEILNNKSTISNLKNSLLKLKEIVERQRKEIFAIKQNLNLEKIYRFAEYKENWDGYGAPPFDKSVIELAVKFIFDKNLKIQPNVFPTGRGSIQFEFEPDDNHYLEIEIFKDKYNLLTIIESKEEELSDIDFEKIIQKVNDFQSRFCS